METLRQLRFCFFVLFLLLRLLFNSNKFETDQLKSNHHSMHNDWPLSPSRRTRSVWSLTIPIERKKSMNSVGFCRGKHDALISFWHRRLARESKRTVCIASFAFEVCLSKYAWEALSQINRIEEENEHEQICLVLFHLSLSLQATSSGGCARICLMQCFCRSLFLTSNDPFPSDTLSTVSHSKENRREKKNHKNDFGDTFLRLNRSVYVF